MKKIVTLLTCALIIFACFIEQGFMIWYISNDLPRNIMEGIGCVMMLAFPLIIICLTVAGLYEYLGKGGIKKLTTVFICTFIVLALFETIGYILWQIHYHLPFNNTMELLGCVMMLTIPGMLIYITLAGLVEYLKD